MRLLKDLTVKSPNIQDAPFTPPLPVENGPQFPPSEGQEDNPDSEENLDPEQGTDPAPQTLSDPQVYLSRYSFSLSISQRVYDITSLSFCLKMMEQQDEAAAQMDQATENQLP